MAAPRLTARHAAAFTLVEVMIALAVTGVGLAGVAALSVSNAHGVSYARHATEATILAEDQLERLNTWSWPRLVSGADRVDAQGVALASGGFERVWVVQHEGDLARITLEVSWDEGGDVTTLSFSSARSR